MRLTDDPEADALSLRLSDAVVELAFKVHREQAERAA